MSNASLNNPIGTLSGGQRQPPTYQWPPGEDPTSCSSTNTPPPSTPKSAGQIVRLTQHIVSQHHLTTLMVTHSMQQAATLAD